MKVKKTLTKICELTWFNIDMFTWQWRVGWVEHKHVRKFNGRQKMEKI